MLLIDDSRLYFEQDNRLMECSSKKNFFRNASDLHLKDTGEPNLGLDIYAKKQYGMVGQSVTATENCLNSEIDDTSEHRKYRLWGCVIVNHFEKRCEARFQVFGCA